MSNTTYVPVRAASELLGADVKYDPKTYTVTITQGEITYDVTITFPADRYPETAAHIKAAIAKGESAVCTIDRDGADENREESLKGIPTKDGYDRDEWPMAMCAEGGTGADVAYVESSDNRGAGAWVGNALEEYPDGTRVLFVISGGAGTTTNQPETSTGNDPSEPTNQQSGTVVYETCKAAREAGAAPLYVGDPGYSKKLDRDGDGVACES
ncbi:excalibur calcium-binding domain-containing protein [Cohnella algarum]|nr:excalibur calcium-binding domain-containing protein [Cohnella algarum]